MKQHIHFSLVLVFIFVGLAACGQSRRAENKRANPADSVYEYRDSQSRDGIGKYYMGREISDVMGHLGAGWLERPDREQEERTDLLTQALKIKPTDIIADIGAGSGYFTFRLSPFVPQGKVIAVDIQPEMLEMLEKKKRQLNIGNVDPLKGEITNPNLPANSVDLVLLVDAYHEFSHPREMMTGIVRALKSGGRVVLVEYRAEDPAIPIKPLHKMTQQQAIKEMQSVGLKWLSTSDILPQQHMMFFQKPEN